MAGLLEFAARFGTAERCIEHLAGLRWPGGFVCSGCGGRQAWRLKARPRVYECGTCHRQESVTAGTVFDNLSRYPGIPISRPLMCRALTDRERAQSGGADRHAESDSPAEEDGFEPLVPLAMASLDSRGGEGSGLERRRPFSRGDQRFESPSLRQGVGPLLGVGAP
jgi:hypothetical protein